MAPSQSLDLIEHFRQDAVVTRECITHIEYRACRARGMRKEKVERRWYRERTIGHGAFGRVWLEVSREDGDVQKRALKIIDKSRMLDLDVDYKKELLALAKFSKDKYQHEEVLVNFFGWFEDSENLFISMEYFELGDLEKHITESITEDDVKDMTIDVLNGLRIMHSENFAHRDLKPSNIFVVRKPPASKWWVKIGDFGISKRVQGDITALRTKTGTLTYQAPEINGYLDDGDDDELTSVYDNAVDMWSLGCVIYKIATQKVLFPQSSAVSNFCNGRRPFPEQLLLAKMGMVGVEFVKSLIVPDPRQRLSAESALEASWLSQRKRDTILETEKPVGRSTPKIAQTANLSLRFPRETGMALHGKKLAAGVMHSHGGPLEVADEVLNEKGDKEMSLLQTPDDETVRLQPLQNTTISLLDSKVVVSASRDRTARLWGAATGAACGTLEGHGGPVYAVAFSPDGKMVASASWDKTVRLWDAATGAGRGTLKGHEGAVCAVAFSPDGKVVASASSDKTARLWGAATGAARGTLKGHEGPVYAVAFSLDGKVVVSVSWDKTVRFWDVATGAARGTLDGHEGAVWAVAFSPDGKAVASASSDRTARLWDAFTGAARGTLKGHKGAVYAVAFSPDGKVVASASSDATVRLWDAATGAARGTLEGHEDDVWAVAFSPDGEVVASASWDKTVRLWDVATGAGRGTLEGHEDHVNAVAFSPDGKVVASASSDKTVRLWDAATGS
jgi:WD40 repeat protein